MKRYAIVAWSVAGLLAAASAWAAPPFGSFGGKVGGGNSGAGLLPLHGWALDDDGIESVDVFVDGVIAQRALYGRARPAVTQRFPGFPNSALPGFALQLDTTHFLNGRHTIGVQVTSLTGEVTPLNSRVFNFTNTTHNLAPFGKIEFPNRSAELRGECNLADPARRFSVVSGYALDAGVQEDDTGVGYVELLIDRARFANSRVDCRSSAVEGGLSDCYGLRRLDIETFFPTLPDAPHSGFRFVLDVGLLVEFFGYTPGHHTLTVRAGDLWGTVRKIAEIPVTFACDDGSDELAIGLIEAPAPRVIAGSVVQALGWVVDFQGVNTIEVYVDGIFQGLATHGLIRPEITLLFPSYPEALGPGWIFLLDTTTLANGWHDLNVVVTDDLGNDTLIGERRFFVGNP
jgi:hypothetical protein